MRSSTTSRRGRNPPSPRSRHTRGASLLAATLLLSFPALAEAPATSGDAACAEGRAGRPGVCASAEAVLDGFANLRGGLRRGVAALAELRVALDVDLGAVLGLPGWSARVSVFGIYGRQPTPTLIGSFAPVSDAEAVPTARLSELWAQRDLGGFGSIRFGQLAADTEFFALDAVDTLSNGTFGWPLAVSTALPSGGPGYPLAAPGARLALGDPEARSGLRLAVFSGDPAGRYGDETEPQRHNRYGTTFSFADGALYMAEGVVGAPAPAGGGFRPWVAKLGGWYHTGGFPEQRRLPPLSDIEPPISGILPDPGGAARRLSGNHGVYAVGEAVLWRARDAGLAVFGRFSVTPGQRNLLTLYGDAGLAWRGPFGQVGDTASLGLAYARASRQGRARDREEGVPVRDREIVVEANYEFSVVPDHLFLRPGVQWVSHPGLGAADDRRGPGRLPDAVALGMRVRGEF